MVLSKLQTPNPFLLVASPLIHSCKYRNSFLPPLSLRLPFPAPSLTDNEVATHPISSSLSHRLSLSLRGKPSSGLQCVPFSKSRQPLHVCFAGEKGMMGNNSEDSPWKALEKAMEKFKGQSVEDVLKRQIQKGEYLDDGGSGAKPPRGGSGGGSGSSEGPGGSEEESFGGMLDETLQAALATFGFIFLYIYILTGEELAKLARDYIRYMFTGKQSVRLKRAMSQWGQYYLNITEKQVVDKYCLEKAILNTPTWWNDPEDYREVVMNYLESNNSDE
ncbi:uncharacterized protein LOC129313937 [Prosopis cineraria]|uniref:uncharacterized protein LOC129313937 n=1 Tax=Prosopis cineraria TaxID=364024 RepID=UPI0024105E51|nr:uncharacterized protein LOC129313937 [Prosopis cineraria]